MLQLSETPALDRSDTPSSLGDPGPVSAPTTLQLPPASPAPQDALFITVIVTLPIVQIIALVTGLTYLGLELLPMMKKTALYRSFVFRVIWLTLQTFFAVLFYQVRANSRSSLVCAWIGMV